MDEYAIPQCDGVAGRDGVRFVIGKGRRDEPEGLIQGEELCWVAGVGGVIADGDANGRTAQHRTDLTPLGGFPFCFSFSNAAIGVDHASIFRLRCAVA